MLSYLCNISGVSRSGYYKHFSNVTVQKRNSNKIKDLESIENILKAYNFKNRKKGARQIKMILVKEIDEYIEYYNNFRGQWNLKR